MSNDPASAVSVCQDLSQRQGQVKITSHHHHRRRRHRRRRRRRRHQEGSKPSYDLTY